MMKKYNLVLVVLLFIVLSYVGYNAYKIQTTQKKFAIVLQAGKDTHEGMARAVHALLYAAELKEKGYDVVLIFDGAGTEWAEELSNPGSQSKLLPMYQSLKKMGVVEVICDFCALAFGVKEKVGGRKLPLVSEYKGHPSIEKWIKKGYRLIIL